MVFARGHLTIGLSWIASLLTCARELRPLTLLVRHTDLRGHRIQYLAREQNPVGASHQDHRNAGGPAGR